MKKIHKNIDLSVLPRIETGRNIGCINWQKCDNYEVVFKYDNIDGIIKIKEFDKNTGKLLVIYNDTQFYITRDNFSKCCFGKILGKFTSSFKIEIGTQLKDDKRDLTIIDREHRKGNNGKKWKYYKYHCNKCSAELWIEESNLKRGDKCSCCVGHIVIERINDIPTTAPWMVKYFQGGYDEAKMYTKLGTGNSNNFGGCIYPICPCCGRIRDKKIKIRDIYINKSTGCTCNDGQSYPNKTMFNILEQLNVDFKTEYSPDWIKPKRYDFYIPSKQLIIEMDGQFHNRVNNMNGQTVEESKVIDDYKDELAKLHDIEVIRIDCDYPNMETRFEYIKNNILNSERLNESFDLSKVSWSKTNIFALSNLVKIACNLWNSEYNIKEISEILHIDATTTRKYLRDGKTVDWCNYNGKEEQKKNNKIISNKMSKPIICLTENKSFKSISEASKYYNLGTSTISMVCSGKRKTANGMVFKYEV